MSKESESFLHFSKAQRYFIAILVLFGTVLNLIPFFKPQWLGYENAPIVENWEERELKIKAWIDKNEYIADSISRTKRKTYKRKSFAPKDNISRNKPLSPPPYQSLNPNTVNFDQLISIGLSERLAKRWLSYTKKGGTFFSKKDIAKIYGLNEELYFKISDYFIDDENVLIDLEENFDSQLQNQKKQKIHVEPTDSNTYLPKKKFEKKASIIEVNNATFEDLISIKGIGKFYANKIMNYRDRLGGFHSIKQIEETYGLREGAYDKFKQFLRVDSTAIQPILINYITKEKLAKHPYVDNDEATVIVLYRNNHGPYKNINELRNAYPIQEVFDKIAPYVNFD